MCRCGRPDAPNARNESSRNCATALLPASRAFDAWKAPARASSAGVRSCWMVAFIFDPLSGRGFGVVAVSPLFQFERQFLSAAALNSSLRHHMDRIGHDVVEKP